MYSQRVPLACDYLEMFGSSHPHFKQNRYRVDVRRLAAGAVIFTLVVNVSSKALSEFLVSPGRNSVPGPAAIL